MRHSYGAYTIATDGRGQPQVLGRGGFSSVYLARHATARGEFALKLLDPLPGNDRDALTRFKRELDAAKRVNSRYVSRVYEWELDVERPWIAMQYVPGQTLRDVLRDTDEGRLTLGDALKIAHQVALAIVDLDRSGVTHRDITPSNIMISPGLNVTLIDLGLALAPQAERVTSYAVGTLDYMSPEALLGPTQTASSDLWSLGVVLAKAAGGRLPFKGQNDAITIDLIRDAPPDVACAPFTIRGAVKRLLEKNPDDRPPPHRVAIALDFLQLAVSLASDHAESKPRDRLRAATFRGDRPLVRDLVAAGAGVVRDMHGYSLDALIDIGEIRELMDIVRRQKVSGDDLAMLALDAGRAGAADDAVELLERALRATPPMTQRRDYRRVMSMELARAGHIKQSLQLINYLDDPSDKIDCLEVAAYASRDPELLDEFRQKSLELDIESAAWKFSKLVLKFGRASDTSTFHALVAQIEPERCANLLKAHARDSCQPDDVHRAIENGRKCDLHTYVDVLRDVPAHLVPRDEVATLWRELCVSAERAPARHPDYSYRRLGMDNPLSLLHGLLPVLAAQDSQRARELFDLCADSNHRPRMHRDFIRATASDVAAETALREFRYWARHPPVYGDYARDLAAIGTACLNSGLVDRARECLSLINDAATLKGHYDVGRLAEALRLAGAGNVDAQAAIDDLLASKYGVSSKWIDYLEQRGLIDCFTDRLRRQAIDFAAEWDGSGIPRAPYRPCRDFAAALIDTRD